MDAESLEILKQVIEDARNQNEFNFDFWTNAGLKYKIFMEYLWINKEIYYICPDAAKEEISFIFTDKTIKTFKINNFGKAVWEENELYLFDGEEDYFSFTFYSKVDPRENK